MKVIITGATGFLGRNIAQRLHQEGVRVIATGRRRDVGQTLQSLGIGFKAADLLRQKQVNQVFCSADAVIHCAARTGDHGSNKDFFLSNVIGTRHVIQACRTHRIKKIIFISTPSIYYNGRDRFNISEDEPLPRQQKILYSKTKLVCEKELMGLQPEGFQVMIFRPRALYGPYDETIMPRILRMAGKKKFPLINNGQALTDITYVGNFVDLIMAGLAAADPAWNEVYNVSNGDPISMRDWFAQVLKILDRPFKPQNIPLPVAMTIAGLNELIGAMPMVRRKPAMTRFSVGYVSRSMTMSIDKAREKLRYRPRVGNRLGFERYAQWYHDRQAGDD